MKVYWCNIQPILSDPTAFLRWCSVHRIAPEDYLCMEDAVRHLAGLQLSHLAQKNDGAPFTSVSHSGGLVVCAASRRPVGIDTEERTAVPPVPAGFFTQEESAWMENQPDPAGAFFRLWTRKESLIKARHSVLADIPLLPTLVENGVLQHRSGGLEIRELAILPAEYCVSISFEQAGPIRLIALAAEQIFPV